MTARRVADPDRLAALEEERDFLLRSLDDLDAEHAGGELDDDDHRALRDDYTARAAATIRAIEAQREVVAGPRRSPRRFLLGAAVAVVFAVAAGLALAAAMGQREPGGTITGTVDSPRARVLECQQIGADPNRLLESIRCFDEVLAVDPGNAEALAYRGWYLVLAWRSSGDAPEARELLPAGLSYLDRAIAADPALPDARAFRAVAAEWAGDPATACEQLGELARRPRPPMIDQLTAPLAERLSCSAEGPNPRP